MTETVGIHDRWDGDGVGGLLDGSITFEELREKAIELRREGLSRRQIRDRLKVGNNDILNRLLEGEPPPVWTRRPNAKDDLRAKARELRLEGLTYDQIQLKLGVSKSSISLWVRDLPRPERNLTEIEQGRLANRMRWDHELQVRDTARRDTKQAAAAEVGQLSDRELLLVGAVLYWAEGAKDKVHSRRESIQFINSDPHVIRVFLGWLELLGVDRTRLRCRVYIHESGDVEGAARFWSEVTEVPVEEIRISLKKHNPKTVRKNTGEAYNGCLAIYVTQSAELYRRMEGWWSGIVAATRDSVG